MGRPGSTEMSERRLDRLLRLQSLLFEVSREIGPALELQPVLEIVLRAMRDLVEFKGGTICLVDNREVYIAAADPPVAPEVMAARLPVGEGLAGRVVASGEPIYSPSLDEDPRVVPELRRLATNQSIVSYLAVPLVCFGEVTGLLQVDSSEVDAFDEDDLRVLQGLGTQVAGSIESARRYEAMLEVEQLKSDFVARVSHELRTPLTILSGYTTTILEHDGSLSAAQREEFLLRIQDATGRLRHLLEEVLTITSLQSGMTAPRPTDTVLAEVLREVVSTCAHPEQVTVACPADLRLTTDPAVLHRILDVLVDNALKYGGGAELAAEVAGGGHVEVHIRDHGPGVPEELREVVFQRFVRGTHTVAGMGLGLPIAQQLAASIRARVELRKSDAGACFTVVVER